MKSNWGIRVCVVVGVLLILYGIASTGINTWKSRNYAKTTGVITNVDKYVDADMITRYTRTYTYQVDGVDYEITESSSDNKPELGTEKDIVYDPEDPASAEIVQSTSDDVILIIMGIIWLVVAAVIKKRVNKEAMS